ncbi:hypothetical protein [Salinibacter altiplanensis]|nr:hypothetical protein [Salinibacter altiplanensis]
MQTTEYSGDEAECSTTHIGVTPSQFQVIAACVDATETVRRR